MGCDKVWPKLSEAGLSLGIFFEAKNNLPSRQPVAKQRGVDQTASGYFCVLLDRHKKAFF